MGPCFCFGSTANREVFFFPSDDDLSTHIVVDWQIVRTVDLKLAAYIQTPIGVVISIVENIGGWVNKGDGKGYSDASQIGINTPLLGQSDLGVNYARSRRLYVLKRMKGTPLLV